MLSSPGSSVTYKAQIWDVAGEAEDAKADDAGVRKSMYVDIFESMRSIVLEYEKFLFIERELACLERLRSTLSYPARYLLIRLCLCKRGKWHTLASLEARYKSEIGDKAAISAAIDELCGIVRAAPAVVGQEVIDLTVEDECAAVGTSADVGSSSRAGPSSRTQLDNNDLVPGPVGEKDDLSVFAKDDEAASVEELLSCLPVDDLKSIAKDMKLPRTAQNRTALMDAILANASQQTTLNFSVLANAAKSKKSGGLVQLTLNFPKGGKKGAQHATVRRLMSKLMGRCVRIEPAIFALFDRLNLVFFRSTTHSPSLLLPALLAAFHKREYNETEYRRTWNIWPSREALLAYEDALILEFRIDEILGGEDGGVPGAFTRKTPLNAKQGKGKAKVEDDAPMESSRVEGARVVRGIWEQVYGKWKDAVACKDEENVKKPGLERFECGHVLTRIVYKGSRALGILKEYELEMQVLKELLSQTKWRRGRRGEWYDRLALVLMTHTKKTTEDLETAMNTVICGLKDEFTHMTYRPRLQRRLARLENMLKIPKDQRHICDGKLQKASEVHLEGIRLYQNRSASVVLDTSGRVKRTTASPSLDRPMPETPFKVAADRAATQPPEREKPGASKGKTLWLGRNGEEVSVEQYALEYYESLGFKGFHSEGRIVSMLFGLLFWDVIFAPIRGAFETPYQVAPLDIYEDSFHSARADIITQRLKELENGEAPEIIRRIDESKRPNNTWCIGVDWKFERDDLLEIVQCLGGNALSIICRTVVEDYSQWGGGVPDLFVWNAEDSTCKFVEVKSTNDTLQENQKVWIDVLLGSGTSVDLCHVVEKGAEKKPKKGIKKKAQMESSDLESEDGVEMETEENYELLDPSQEDTEESKGGKRARGSDDSLPSPKKRKVEATPRKRRRD